MNLKKKLKKRNEFISKFYAIYVNNKDEKHKKALFTDE